MSDCFSLKTSTIFSLYIYVHIHLLTQKLVTEMVYSITATTWFLREWQRKVSHVFSVTSYTSGKIKRAQEKRQQPSSASSIKSSYHMRQCLVTLQLKISVGTRFFTHHGNHCKIHAQYWIHLPLLRTEWLFLICLLFWSRFQSL